MTQQIDNIFVELGYACTSQCDYCFQKKSREEAPDNRILPHECLDWIDRMMRAGVLEDNFFIRFYGGEPLLYRKEIKDIILDLRRRGIAHRPSIQTNGMLLSQEVFSWCRALGIRVFLSMDGAYDVQTAHRISKETFHYPSFIENASRLIARQKSGVTVQSTVTQDCAHRLYETYLFMKSLGFSEWHYELEVLNGADWDQFDARVLDTQLKKIVVDYMTTPKTMKCIPIERVLAALEGKINPPRVAYLAANGRVSMGRELPILMHQAAADFFSFGDFREPVDDYLSKLQDRLDYLGGQIMRGTSMCRECPLSNYCHWEVSHPKLEGINSLQPMGHCFGQLAILGGLREWRKIDDTSRNL